MNQIHNGWINVFEAKGRPRIQRRASHNAQSYLHIGNKGVKLQGVPCSSISYSTCSASSLSKGSAKHQSQCPRKEAERTDIANVVHRPLEIRKVIVCVA